MDAEQGLAEDLRRAVGQFVRATRAEADRLPPIRAEVLGRLDRNGPQTIAQLASWRGVRHQSMSRMIAELEQLDLIDRAPNPSDRRGFVIAISRAGRAALDRDRRGRRDLLATAIRTRLSKEERRALAAIPGILDKLRTV